MGVSSSRPRSGSAFDYYGSFSSGGDETKAKDVNEHQENIQALTNSLLKSWTEWLSDEKLKEASLEAVQSKVSAYAEWYHSIFVKVMFLPKDLIESEFYNIGFASLGYNAAREPFLRLHDETKKQCDKFLRDAKDKYHDADAFVIFIGEPKHFAYPILVHEYFPDLDVRSATDTCIDDLREKIMASTRGFTP